MNSHQPVQALRRTARHGRRLLLSLALLTALSPAAHAATQVLADVTGIEAAENSIQTASGRIFVSSKGGIFELKTVGTSWSKAAVPAVYDDGKTRACYFLGMAEWLNTLYSVCTENSGDAAAPKFLMGLDLNASVATLREVGKLRAQGIPNGLASDGRGTLYLANLASLAPGNIWRLSLAGRGVLAVQTPVYQFPALNPNGVKFHAGQLYVSANPPLLVGTSELMRFPVNAGQLGTPTTLYSSSTFLDDFGLVQGGFVVAHFLTGAVKHLSEAGGLLHSATFLLPTSATFIRNGAVPSNGLLVTQMGTNRATIVKTDWGITSR